MGVYQVVQMQIMHKILFEGCSQRKGLGVSTWECIHPFEKDVAMR